MSSAISGLSTHFDTNSDLGSNFGTIFGPNESLSHDSHSQNQSIKSTEILRIVKSQETKNEWPETLICNAYSRRKKSTITSHVSIFVLVTQVMKMKIWLLILMMIWSCLLPLGKEFDNHHSISQLVSFQHLLKEKDLTIHPWGQGMSKNCKNKTGFFPKALIVVEISWLLHEQETLQNKGEDTLERF